jgi:AcrR family transcriptional regulator
MSEQLKTRKRSEAPRLGPDDWLDAAFRAVTEGGFDNVRVLALADTLKVTRGSFYWHYEDHPALIAALLKRWRAREVAGHQLLMNEAMSDPEADVERLLEAALSHPATDQGNIRFELALRDLGRRDEAVASLLVEVDAQRMALFESKFTRLTGDAKSGGDLASLFYLAIVGGNHALSGPGNPAHIKESLKRIISTYLIKPQVPR